jgi:hypothetical protein
MKNLKTLSHYFNINRRYARSINLERDLDSVEAVIGYIPTERSLNALRRIIASFEQSSSNRAWTLTGVYGTGKSAFAHYLAALCAPEKSELRRQAFAIVENTLESAEYDRLMSAIPAKGLFRAVATAQREPLAHTMVRALLKGATTFWGAKTSSHGIGQDLVDLEVDIETGKIIDSKRIPNLILELAKAAKTDILLIIDELGKSLESAAQNRSVDDLYLLQQLAELPRKGKQKVYIVGLLHQSFADYGDRLASNERKEWAKIQGRFEDIPFTESSEQMTRLIGQAINRENAIPVECAVHQQSQEWFDKLQSLINIKNIEVQTLTNTYPLHPISALILPILCTKYAQNDRSLFTFLTSAEPRAFQEFLAEEMIGDGRIPSLKLHHIYDYFVEAVGIGMASRPNVQKWVEIQGVISEAEKRSDLDLTTIQLLKTIGVLNLIATMGSLRATHPLVMLALCDKPDDIYGKSSASKKRLKEYQAQLQMLRDRSLLTYRKTLDELRIWEGSEFDVQAEITQCIEKDRSTLIQRMKAIRPLKPVVAQRHSYKTGTLRYFETQYIDSECSLEMLTCTQSSSDGLIAYWIDEKSPMDSLPVQTHDGRPIVIVQATYLNVLSEQALEFAALKKIQMTASELQIDGVARREIRHRLIQAEELLDECLNQAFDLSNPESRCWICGQPETIDRVTQFNSKLSDVCDRVYIQGMTLWNELINRRELTTQGAKARRQLIEGMLERSEQVKLGFEGHGPEVSMYASLLGETGIHREEDGILGFYPPKNESVLRIWKAIEAFCQNSGKSQSLNILYQKLESPPYGMKQGTIPVLIAAVLLNNVDDISIYKDGTFIPVLGAEHFELLVKDPSRFAIKSFAVTGLRAQVFQELEAILRGDKAKSAPARVRNATLLSVVKPLFQFVKKLPVFTMRTQRISAEARAVLKALSQAQEPDDLIFSSLPIACGLEPIVVGSAKDETVAKHFRKILVGILSEIQMAYAGLLSETKGLLYEAFKVRSSEVNLREDLRVRCLYVMNQCLVPSLKRFMAAAIDEKVDEEQWLKAIVMVVADKPPESWTDEDLVSFEVRLGDLARRFGHLEALQKETAKSKHGGFEAKRLTVTRQDGQEIHGITWVDHEHVTKLETLMDEVLAGGLLLDNPQMSQAFAAMLVERVLAVSVKDEMSQARERKNVEKKCKSG